MDTDFDNVIPAEAGIQALSATESTEDTEDSQDGLLAHADSQILFSHARMQSPPRAKSNGDAECEMCPCLLLLCVSASPREVILIVADEPAQSKVEWAALSVWCDSPFPGFSLYLCRRDSTIGVVTPEPSGAVEC